jgi:hypothetical protein
MPQKSRLERVTLATLIVLTVSFLLAASVFVGRTVRVNNQMNWSFIFFLDLFLVGLPLLLTVGIFTIYRRSYLERYPGRDQQVAWGNYSVQMLLLITMMVVIAAGLIWWDSEASKYLAEREGYLPSLVLGRGSIPLYFSIGRESESVRFPTAMFWWAYLGAVISMVNMIMRRFSIGHLVARSYLNSALRLLYALIAVALFFLAVLVWPEVLGQGGSDPMSKRHLLMLFAFFAGVFPTTITHWVTERLRALLELRVRKPLPLTEILGVDADLVKFLNDEGVWSVVDLAARNPGALAASIHVDTAIVENWQRQAQLLDELGDIEIIKHFRQLGINDWGDLAILRDLEVGNLELDDFTSPPDESGGISPVLIRVLKEKARDRPATS